MAIVAGVVILLDQLSKWWAINNLSDRDIDLVWTFRFHLALNHGAAFSAVPGRGALVALLALGIVIVLVVLGRAIDTRPGAIALGLVLGGAIGNLLDRSFRSGSGFLGGGVVDFIDPQWWPIFNVADAAISIGGVLLVVVTSFAPEEQHHDEPA